MQQRQLRLGDILDDYCPRERRLTNHAVVAMIGDDVKQTRCTTCDAEHEYKHARMPRQRKKSEEPAALYAQVAANAPKRVSHDVDQAGRSDAAGGAAGDSRSSAAGQHAGDGSTEDDARGDAQGNGFDNASEPDAAGQAGATGVHAASADPPDQADSGDQDSGERGDTGDDNEAARDVPDDGPVHRPLIRASLPRPEGQQPPQRPVPEFTIRQPGGRPNRFRPRHLRGGSHQGQQGPYFQGNRSNGNMGGPMRGPRPGGGRPGMMKRHGPPGRKRSK